MIVNNFTHPVIKADDRNPFTSWRNHRARGSAGGVDLAYPFRTPIFAPSNGFGSYDEGKGTGGNIYFLYCEEGRIEMMHLDSVFRTGDVTVGDLIGYSGRSGPTGRFHYDPHLHAHIYVDGVRVNLWNYLTPALVWTATAGPTTIELPEPKELELMAEPIYVKGKNADDVYAVYLNADGNTVSGAVYSARRKVELPELLIVEQLGYPHAKQEHLFEIPQDQFDLISKVAGSL